MKGFIVKIGEKDFFIPFEKVVRVEENLRVTKWWGLPDEFEGVCVSEKMVIGVFDIAKKMSYDIKNKVYLLVEGNERMYLKVEKVIPVNEIPRGTPLIDTINEIKKILEGEKNG